MHKHATFGKSVATNTFLVSGNAFVVPDAYTSLKLMGSGSRGLVCAATFERVVYTNTKKSIENAARSPTEDDAAVEAVDCRGASIASQSLASSSQASGPAVPRTPDASVLVSPSVAATFRRAPSSSPSLCSPAPTPLATSHRDNCDGHVVAAGAVKAVASEGDNGEGTTPSPSDGAATATHRGEAESSRWQEDTTRTVVIERVAIKKITRLFDDLTDGKRALREIHILSSLSHPNLLQLRAAYMTSSLGGDVTPYSFDTLYAVTDLYATDLHKVISSGQSLSNDHFEYFMVQAVRGLHYLHSANLLHRDLKPSNLLVNADCSLVICDFGLAREDAAGEPGDAGYKMTTYVVTRWYRAPELLGYNPYFEDSTAQVPLQPERWDNQPFQVHQLPAVQYPVSSQCGGSSSSDYPAMATADANRPSPCEGGDVSGATPPLPATENSAAEHSNDASGERTHGSSGNSGGGSMLNSCSYSAAVDMWSLGLIFAELLRGRPLLPGRNYLHQLKLIVELVGTPKVENPDVHLAFLSAEARSYIYKCLPLYSAKPLETSFPNATPEAIDLLSKLLILDPSQRWTTSQVLRHPYFNKYYDPQLEMRAPEPFMWPFHSANAIRTERELRDAFWSFLYQSRRDLNALLPGNYA